MIKQRIYLLALLFATAANLKSQGFQPPETRMSGTLVNDFIKMHMQYPEEAIKNKEEGIVLILFNINKEGVISDIKFQKSVSPLVDSAALRLFNLVLWEPAKYMGRPVDGSGEFKIRYKIKHYKSLVKKRGYDQFRLPFEPISTAQKIYTIKELDIAPEAITDSSYQSIRDFIVENIQIPEAALKLHLTGEVKLRFIIETNGLPSNIMVIEPLGGGCTEEAERIVEMIRWIPGIKSNEAVRTCYNLSFTFKPPDEIKSKHIPNQSNPGI
jgi:TonB family protein